MAFGWIKDKIGDAFKHPVGKVLGAGALATGGAFAAPMLGMSGGMGTAFLSSAGKGIAGTALGKMALNAGGNLLGGAIDSHFANQQYQRARSAGLADYERTRADMRFDTLDQRAYLESLDARERQRFEADRGEAWAREDNAATRLRAQAEAAGFNPLSLLGSGVGGSGAIALGPGSNAAGSMPSPQLGAFMLDTSGSAAGRGIPWGDLVRDFTGQLLSRQAEKDSALAGVVTQKDVTRGVTSPRVPSSIDPRGTAGPSRLSPSRGVDVSSDGTINNEDMLSTRYVDTDGTSIDLPVGPDIDELVSGVGIRLGKKAIEVGGAAWADINRPIIHKLPPLQGPVNQRGSDLRYPSVLPGIRSTVRDFFN